ncbi:MAG: CPSF A subunit region-domain-containing protein [Monoraphidium minutum]|nr:MAG: CPSF A subunit region-domain-containing protein [Monoraphidium minutum]
MSYGIYKEFHPPTGVTHCVDAYFTHAAPAAARGGAAAAAGGADADSGAAPDLVIARATRLEVYAPAFGAGSRPGGPLGVCRLQLLGSFPLYGVVEDMAVLRGRAGAGQRDAVVLAFRDAKVSVVEWDPSQQALHSSSLHSFEGDAALGGGMAAHAPPRLATDPQGRCAAAVVFGRHLALMPAVEAEALDALMLRSESSLGGAKGGAKAGGRAAAALGNSYLVDVGKDAGVGQVRAAAFLHGYTEPLLLLLHEDKPTWPGRYRERKDTCRLSALSVNLRRKRHPVIWGHAGLPSDCCALMAVPRGGALVLSQNLVLYYTQGVQVVLAINSNAFAGELPPRLEPPPPPPPPNALMAAAAANAAAAAAQGAAAAAAARHARRYALNVHPDAAAGAARGAARAPGLELEADGARGAWVAPNVLLLGLKTGQLVMVSLRFEGGGAAATKIAVAPAGGGPAVSCACSLGPMLLFLGSWAGDSLLVRCATPAMLAAAAAAAAGGGGGGMAPPAKRPRLARLASVDMGGGGGGGGGKEEEEGEEEYRAALGRAASVSEVAAKAAAADGGRYSLKVLDSFPCLGPMRDLVTADLPLAALSSFLDPSMPPPAGGAAAGAAALACAVAAVGTDKAGALALLRRGLAPAVVTAIPQERVHGAWALHHTAPAPGAGGGGGEAGGGEAGSGEAGGGGGGGEGFHAFLLLSLDGSHTQAFDAAGDTLQDITGRCGFIANDATVAAGELFSNSAAAQVTRSAVRLLSGPRQLQHIPLAGLLAAAGHPSARKERSKGGLLDGGPVHIRFAQVLDPHVLVLLSDGSALLLRGDPRGRRLGLARAALPPLHDAVHAAPDEQVSAACLFRDSAGWLAARGLAGAAAAPAAAGEAAAGAAADAGAAAAAAEGGGAKADGEQEQEQQQQEEEKAKAQEQQEQDGKEGADRQQQQEEGGGGEAGPASDGATVAGDAAAASATAAGDAAASATAAGDAAAGGSGGGEGPAAGGGAAGAVAPAPAPAAAQPAALLFVARLSGGLAAYRLPDMALVFEEPKFVIGPAVAGPARRGWAPGGAPAAAQQGGGQQQGDGGGGAMDVDGGAAAGGAGQAPPSPSAGGADSAAAATATVAAGDEEEEDEDEELELDATPIAELRVESFAAPSGPAGGVPGAAAPAFQPSPGAPLSLRRLPLDAAALGSEAPAPPAAGAPRALPAFRMVRFDGLVPPQPPLHLQHRSTAAAMAASCVPYSGVFICGAAPLWLFASRGGLVPHPHAAGDGPVAAMTPFHNVNCPHGFILAAMAEGLRVCHLPAQLRLDTPWLAAKVPLNATPLHLAWYPDARLLALLTQRMGPYRPFLPEEPNGEPNASAAYAAADAAAAAAGREELCELRLVAPPGSALAAGRGAGKAGAGAQGGLWSAPTLWRYPLLPGEDALAVKAVVLRDFAVPEGGGGDPFIAVGTGSPFGEDYPALGRVLLFQARTHSVTTETLFRIEGGSEEAVSGRLALWRDLAGPVVAVECLRGYLVVGVGARLEMHYKQGSALIKAAFFDCPFFLSGGVSVLKDFLLAGDAQRSLLFLRFREAGRQLELLGCDTDAADTAASEFLPNGAKLNLVCADAGGSISIMAYDAQDPESWGGKKLLRRGAAHVGSLATRLARMRMAVPGDTANRQALLAATREGGVGLLASVWDDDMARRLASLQDELAYLLAHPAGLNPKAFRNRYSKIPRALGGGYSHTRPVPPAANGLLMGDLIWRYAGLDLRQQARVAAALGVGRHDVLSDLRALAAATAFFMRTALLALATIVMLVCSASAAPLPRRLLGANQPIQVASRNGNTAVNTPWAQVFSQKNGETFVQVPGILNLAAGRGGASVWTPWANVNTGNNGK